jgi:hypothetical protein
VDLPSASTVDSLSMNLSMKLPLRPAAGTQMPQAG